MGDRDPNAAAKLLSRIRQLDPENAYKIIGYILMHNEQLLSLAQAPQHYIVNMVNQVKLHLGLIQRHESRLLLHANAQGSNMHRRCWSESDQGRQKPFCIFFANGFCRDGDACRFLHAGGQMNRHQQSGFQRFSPWKPEAMGLGEGSSSSSALKQIYLTFPAESTFRDEDVAVYFSNIGPVQDVRIPYQQRRMFGFVTFVHPETAKLALDMGNPHFISGCRVLVKRYKEKGKALERRPEHQQLERTSAFLSPPGVNSQGNYELQLGPHTHMEMMLRRQMQEPADLQRANELQERLVNLQLTDLNDGRMSRHQRSISFSSQWGLPGQDESSQRTLPDNSNHRVIQETSAVPSAVCFASSADTESHLLQEVNTACIQVDYTNQCKNPYANQDASEALDNESGIEHYLPDDLFGSPVKLAWNEDTFSSTGVETATSSAPPASSSSFNYQFPCTSAADAAFH